MNFLDFLGTAATVAELGLSVLSIVLSGIYMFTIAKNIQKTPASFTKLILLVLGLALTMFCVLKITEPMRDPTIVMHIGLWILAIMFTLFLVMGQWLVFLAVFTTLDKPVANYVFLVETVLVIGSIFFVGNFGRASSAVDEAAIKICNGVAVTEAAVYNQGTSLSPLALLNIRTQRGWNAADYPANWLPNSVDEMQLVACIEDDWHILESCKYSGGKNILRREQIYRTVRVVQAASGETLDSFTLTGGVPRACGSSEIFSSNQSLKVSQGDPILPQELFDRLARFVQH